MLWSDGSEVHQWHILPDIVMLYCLTQNLEWKKLEYIKSISFSTCFEGFGTVSPFDIFSFTSLLFLIFPFLFSFWSRHSLIMPPSIPQLLTLPTTLQQGSNLASPSQHRNYILDHSHGPTVNNAYTAREKYQISHRLTQCHFSNFSLL